MKSEVEYAISQLKSDKNPGSDNIYPEIFNLINQNNIDLFVELINQIYMQY